MKTNFYEVLEIPTTASHHDVVMAYEKAKRTYSPQNPALYTVFSEQEAAVLREMIEEAFAVLGNETYRNIYEKRLMAKAFAESDLTLNSIKQASQNLFSDSILPEKTSVPVAAEKQDIVSRDPQFENQIASQSEWSGDFLQKVREYRKLSIENLHEKTKVNPWYIKALESMDHRNLPAPVFVRGYVVQMAKTLGLNEKAVADSYMQIYKQKLDQKQ